MELGIIKPKTFDELQLMLTEGKTGFFDIPDDWYHSSLGESRSNIVPLLRSPMHYKHKKENPDPPSEALIFGTAFHTAFLEPEKFEDKCIVGPSCGKRTKKWKEFKEEYEDQKIILHPEDFDVLNGMLNSIRNHDLAMQLFDTPFKELSAYTFFEGKLVKARYDSVNVKHGFLADLKTTQDAQYHEFQRSTYKYKYHVQSPFYLDVFNAVAKTEFTKFVFVCVEKKPPYAVQCYVCDPALIEKGRELYKQALTTLKHCEKNDVWDGYPMTIQNLTLPRYAYL